ncbi:MAG: molecular chaperone HtpG [Clostridia bacterium]|nr:molecular chaperone HtpG [Clostridia bacterium]
MSNNKEFKAESKRLLELMINSIYTNKEIFLRELISNASDAIDKLHYRSLTDKNLNINKSDLKIRIDIDKEARTITITDNGCGMTEEELDNNLGTIAKSGSLAFKEANEKKDGIDIIGQFGVGFYSAFMVADEVIVTSRSIDSDAAYMWRSKGVEGYSINKADKPEIGTQIVLHIKEDTEDEKYSEFLDENRIQTMIRKYSDYIHYPIEMELEHSHKIEGSDEYVKVRELETINSMVPIWKKDKKTVTEEEYNSFYTEKYFDYEKPLKVIHTSVEGQCKYNALLYIPSKLPFNYYSEEFERGLQLYSSGVLIMDRCEDLIPDYFGFVKGLVDSDDLSLNISREMLQQDRQVKIIAKNIENKIRSELENILNNDREKYEEFFKDFGFQLKFGTYNDYGRNKEKLQDLLLFYSSTEKKMVTLAEYVGRMKKEQKAIYYASGDSVDKIDMLPQVETLKEKEYEVLYLTDKIDEFVLQTIMMYKDNTFQNVSAESVDLDTVEEKEALEKINEENKDLFTFMKEKISSQVQEVRFTHRLKNHPVCLTSEGNLSVDMAKAINAMPNNQNVQARLVLEINEKHEIAEKLKSLYNEDKELLEKYTKILYAQAKLIEGMELDNPTEISNLVCELMTK